MPCPGEQVSRTLVDMAFLEKTIRTQANVGGTAPGPVLDVTVQYASTTAKLAHSVTISVAPGTTVPLPFGVTDTGWASWEQLQLTNRGAADGSAGSDITVEMVGGEGGTALGATLPAPIVGYTSGGVLLLNRLTQAESSAVQIDLEATQLAHTNGGASVGQLVEMLLIGT